MAHSVETVPKGTPPAAGEAAPKETPLAKAKRVVTTNYKVWLWRAFAVVLLLVIYIHVLARGVGNTFPDLGEKLSKLPFLASLARYEETRRLQVSHAFALLFMVIVFTTWEVVLRSLFGDESFFARFRKPHVAKRVMLSVGVVVLAVDAWFYYSGITNQTWGQTTFSLQAVLATLGFIAVNAAATVFSVYLCPPDSVTVQQEASHA